MHSMKNNLQTLSTVSKKKIRYSNCNVFVVVRKTMLCILHELPKGISDDYNYTANYNDVAKSMVKKIVGSLREYMDFKNSFGYVPKATKA